MKKIFFVILLSIFPDLDFIFGFLLGNVNRFHNEFTHSLAFAFLIAVVFSFPRFLSEKWLNNFLFILFLSLFHIGIDFFSGQSLGLHTTYGVPFYYPFHTENIKSSFTLFYGIKHNNIRAFFSLYNLRAVLLEFFFGALMIYVISKNSVQQIMKREEHKKKH